MTTKHSTPYIVPEAVSAEATSVLSEIPPPKDQPLTRDFEANPLTPDEEKTLQLAQLVVAYRDLYAACERLINRARPANKLKHNYFVCADDLMAVFGNMDGRLAALMDGKVDAKREEKA